VTQHGAVHMGRVTAWTPLREIVSAVRPSDMNIGLMSDAAMVVRHVAP
jgi:hypothetical protein